MSYLIEDIESDLTMLTELQYTSSANLEETQMAIRNMQTTTSFP
jgi:hypothetical protein